jgi:glyoxylase-like metal-dependent hydrolase (beta-lactamase superfamily II)
MKLKIHYLNCGTFHPRFASIFVPELSETPCLCMLIEAGEQLILVDCGLGTKDMADLSRLGLPNRLLLNAQSDPTLPAVRQVQKLGFSTKDVRHVICTHLDRDHAGGLPDFPDASVHVMSAERDAVLNPRGPMENQRYRKCHFEHGPQWVTHDVTSNEEWFGVRCIHELPDLPPEIVMVPLNGHSRGHCGVAVDTGDGWVLHCGDAYYVKQELERAPIGVRAFRRMAHADDYSGAMAAIDQVRLALRNGKGAVTAIAAHDKYEYKRIFGKRLE